MSFLLRLGVKADPLGFLGVKLPEFVPSGAQFSRGRHQPDPREYDVQRVSAPIADDHPNGDSVQAGRCARLFHNLRFGQRGAVVGH